MGDNFTVELTPKEFAMVTECIEYISANERRFDEENENILKSIAEKFHAEYYEECNISDSDNNLKISFQ